MSGMQMTRTVHAPRERVFDLLADLEGAPARIAGIEKIEILTDGPVGVGTRWRETRRMGKRAATEEMEISAFDPPAGYDVTCESCGCTFTYRWRCTATGDGTRVDLDMDWKANTLLAKLMAPVGWLMKGAMKKCVEKDLDDLQRAAEDAEPAEAGA